MSRRHVVYRVNPTTGLIGWECPRCGQRCMTIYRDWRAVHIAGDRHRCRPGEAELCPYPNALGDWHEVYLASIRYAPAVALVLMLAAEPAGVRHA